MTQKDIRCIIIDMQAKRKRRIMRSDTCPRDILRAISSPQVLSDKSRMCVMTRECDERNRYDLLGGRSRFQDHFTRDLTRLRPQPCTMFARRLALAESLWLWGEIDVTRSRDLASSLSVRNRSTGNHDSGGSQRAVSMDIALFIIQDIRATFNKILSSGF